MKKIFPFIVLILFFVFAPKTYAGEDNKFVTIVNPVRISKYTKNPAESVRSEYSVIKKYNLPATWLLTYDALNDREIISEVKKMDKNQEFGVFLEITSLFSESVGVEYNETGSWHHANSVFLSGYTQEERIIFINKIFEKYREVFGSYPKSIGSWWTDGYSLSYIKEKYGVVVNLVCADQFSTDNYQLWGQPWQTPYYPTKLHPAIPASNIENKLDLVNIQWAPRDPLNGYNSSLYSTQDYLVTENSLDTEYFKNLLGVYLDNQESDFAQITVGLESDLDPGAYLREFPKQMSVVKEYEDLGVNVVTMSDFANQYQKLYPDISPNTKIKSKDLLNSGVDAYWFTSSHYRLFYTHNKNEDSFVVRDIRIYSDNLVDPYYVSPNFELNLSINIPSIVDSKQNSKDQWVLPGDVEVTTNDESIVIKGKNLKVPTGLSKNPLVNIKTNNNEIEISFIPIDFGEQDGDIVRGFSSEAIHFFRTKAAIFKLLTGKGWEHFNKMDYLIPQGEIHALFFLKSLSRGKVMVYDNECLQCSWNTDHKPIVFANLRAYVKKYSGHKIVHNSSVFEAETRAEALKSLQKTRAKYVYLVKFEGYSEKLPFSPGDLGVEKIYANANAEIWKVNNK